MIYTLKPSNLKNKVKRLIAAGEGEIDSEEVLRALVQKCKELGFEPYFVREYDGMTLKIDFKQMKTATDLGWKMLNEEEDNAVS